MALLATRNLQVADSIDPSRVRIPLSPPKCFKLLAEESKRQTRGEAVAAAGTHVELNAEILTYPRNKGAFAGVGLDGAVVQVDQSGNKAVYGSNVTRQEILDGKVTVPQAAQSLLKELAKYAAQL